MALSMDIQATYQQGFELRCDGRYAEAKVELAKVLQADRPTPTPDGKWG